MSGQILVPLAGDLADEAIRGQVVGTVVAGLLTGILTSRTVSGLITGMAGWRAIVLGGISFGVLTMFWTALTFLLSAPPFSFPVTVIGLLGLVGLAGAVAAQRAGRLHWPSRRSGVAWGLVLVAFVSAGLGRGR